MANAYTAGAVTAKITIDTKNFKHNVDDLIARVEVLKSHLQEVGSFNDISKKVKELESELSTTKTTFSDLSKKVEDYKKQLKTLRDENKSLQQSLKDAQTALKNRNQTLDESIKKNKKLINSNKNLDKSLDNTVKSSNKYSNTLNNAKKANEGLSKFQAANIKNLNSEAIATDKVTTALKKEEVQAQRTTNQYRRMGTELNKSFTKELYKAVSASSGRSVELKPIYEQLKSQFKPLVRNRREFDKLWADALPRMGASLYPTRDSDLFANIGGRNFGYIDKSALKSIEEVKASFKEIEKEETKVATESVKIKENFSKIDGKTINKATNAVKALAREETKATVEATKLNAETSKIGSNKGIDKTTKSITKLNTEQRKAGLEAKRNARIYDSMRFEASKYLNGLKRGRHSNGVVGTDTALWANFEDATERTRTFDHDRFADHMRKTFEGAVPDDVFDSMFRKLRKQYEIGMVGWIGDRGGIPESKLKDLDLAASIVESKRRNAKRTNLIDDYLGLGGYSNQLRERNIEKASKALNTFNRGLKATAIDYRKLDSMGNAPQYTAKNFETATQALNTFNRGLKATSVDYNKLNAVGNIPQYTAKNFETATKALNTFDRLLKTTNVDIGIYGRRLTETGKYINQRKADLRKQGKVKDAFGVERTIDGLKASTQLDLLPKLEQKGVEAGKKLLGEYLKVWSEAPITVNRSVNEIKSAMSKFVDLNKRNTYVPLGGNDFKRYSNDWELTAEQLEKGTQGFRTLERRVKSTEINVEGFIQIYSQLGSAVGAGNHYLQNALNSFRGLGNGVEIQKQRLKQFAAQTKATFETMQVELAKANAATYKYWKQVRGTADVKGYNQLGTLDTGINQYYGQIDKINSKLAEFKRQQQSVNDSVNQSYNTFAKASEGLALLNKELDKYGADVSKYTQKNAQMTRQVQQLKTQIGAFSKTELGAKAFAGTTTHLNILSNRLTALKESFRTGKISQEEYRQGIERFGKQLSTLHTKIQTITRDLQQGNLMFDNNGKLVTKSSENYNKMSKGMTQTAHSGRILSNTLYQIRGALLSLKMIFTAMGGMALWGFGMEMVESVKTTMTARNEMMAQLNQNSHIDASGIQYFTNSLDDLTKEFKKVNKYAIGETASSIGLEFNLNAEQMKKALPIITMISSEYVRAGRKEEEAALAVKDILQGEFQRLSRETGVGKEELIAYGWDENKENIDGLLTALNKAALDRHWDIFAKKATSLNDVLTITKSRFSETGADILDSATPMIVEGFNLIIKAIDDIQKGFNGLNAFWQNFITVGGGVGLLGTIGTMIPMVTKGMGLADIATIGWTKSLATAALNLNKATVAQYGFKKALAEVITGTKAGELANTRWSKSIMGRILGLKQSTLAEKGYLTSLVQSNLMLKGKKEAQALAMASTMNFKEKLVYLTTSMKANEVQGISSSKAVLKMATSWKILRTILLGVIGIGLVSWLSSVAVQADLVKKRISKFNEIAASGKSKIDEMTKLSETYQKQMDKYEGSNKKWKQDKYETAKNNKAIVEGNKKELELSYKAVQSYKAQNEEREKSIKLTQSQFRKDLLIQGGHTAGEATEKSLGYYDSVKQAQYEITKSYNEQYKWLESSKKHISESVGLMVQEKREQKDIDKYINEYATVAEEAGEHLKQFYQGDMYAGLYYLLDLLKLQWIDLWNNQVFVDFWKSVQKTWEDIKPTAYALKDAIQGIGETILKFLSTDNGRWVGFFAGMGLTIGGLAYKFRGFLGTLKDVGSSIWSRIKDFKKLKKTAEETSDVLGDSSTGGITGENPKKLPKNRGEWLTDMRGQLMNDITKYARAFVGIAAAMTLLTEAILLLNAPMMGLAATGWTFKQLEPEIRKGIDGLKLIAPVMAVFLPPIIALMVIMDKYGKAINMETLADSFLKSATGIAMAITLVTEAIFLLNMPLIALGSLGAVYGSIKTNAQQGITAMKTVNDALYALVPWIPVFIAGIVLAAAASTGVGAIGLVEVAMGIAIGIGLVTEAIFLLNEPLIAIATVGQTYQSLDGVQEGAEALKLTAEALTYVGEAMAALALVDISLLTQHVSDIISRWTGVDLGGSLTDLTADGGVIDQLNTFAQEFNKFEFVEIDQAKVQALATAGDGVGTVGTAMQKVKTAMDNLPPEFKNNNTGERLGITGNNPNGTGAEKQVGESQGYFDAFKEPIRQLKDFVYDFNHSDEFNIEQIDTARVSAISGAADMITQINTAVEKVKTAMQNVGSAGHETAFAEGGAFMALGYDLFHMTGEGAINNGQGSGQYKSSLGSSLQAMEDIISDMFTFQTNLSKYSGGEGGEGANVGGLSNMITIVQDAISKLSQTLSDGIPTIKQNGKSLGNAIVNGFKEGSVGINSVGSGIPAKIANGIMTNKDMVYNTANSLGKTTATKFKEGVNPMSDYMTWELSYVKEAMTSRKDELGQVAYDLGAFIAARFKEGDDINSPGIMARSIQDEIGYIGNYLSVNNLPQMAFDLSNALASNFKVDFNLGNFQLPDMTQWTSNLSTVLPILDGFKTQVSTKFDGMKTNVQNSFNSILSKTRTTMTNMQSSTIGHIGNIKSSWHGMQSALISSAEYIKSQTTSKIDKLKTNLGDFWNKVRNPDQLIGGSAGALHSKGTIRRRSRPHMSVPKGHYAGGFNFKPKRNTKEPSDFVNEYLQCVISTGKPCYAGGWNFDWTDKISNKFKGWKTHFAKFHLDDYLNVGKFENDNFPVRGNAEVAKAYIYDVISATNYDGYFDSRFGDDPVAALRAGVFNCWDGANIILAIARAFGFTGGGMGHGSWNGIGHVWASIPGLGNIDATAIQRGYGFTSPKVSGYAGSMPRKYVPRNPESKNSSNNTNHNEVHIHITGDVYGIDDLNSKIEEGANRVARQLFRDSYSGV